MGPKPIMYDSIMLDYHSEQVCQVSTHPFISFEDTDLNAKMQPEWWWSQLEHNSSPYFLNNLMSMCEHLFSIFAICENINHLCLIMITKLKGNQEETNSLYSLLIFMVTHFQWLPIYMLY
jgi:hypothetical protein